uniref:Dynein light intermediate chain n=1 Tax=Caenorhabditis japonica TaxID=281687 RepID=A0A8R1IYY7_CAEJA
MCTPCLLPITIVASKYDEFQNFESEKRRHLCQYLRFLAYFYGANLMMYSSKMEQFPKLVKNMTSHFAFGTVCPQGYMVDHNKPMFVKCGFDNFESIGMPPSAENFMGTASSPYHMWKDSFVSLYPQKSGTLDHDGQNSSKSDPMTDPTFREPNIDNLVEMKRKELENHIRQKRDREAAEARAAERISKINMR